MQTGAERAGQIEIISEDLKINIAILIDLTRQLEELPSLLP